MVFDLLLKLLRIGPRPPDIEEAEDGSSDLENPFPEPVVIEFRDVIDLHSIPPRQIKQVVEDYIEEAHERGVQYVRIIHGKGVGVQREAVRSILSRSPFVAEFRDAPPEAGGWGATIVTMVVERKQQTTDN
jgi:dsDNA-specific endonuclease/ATPase MutS2